MSKKKIEEKLKDLEDAILEEGLPENEEPLIGDDIEIEVMVSPDKSDVYVKFSGFTDDEDADEYADFLAETLPLLLFGGTRMH